MTMTWLAKYLISLVLVMAVACDPCWDKKDNLAVLQCMAKYPSEDILQYSSVASHLEKHKVYVSLTTSPKRISKIHWVLKSLDLTYVDTIFLALPEKYKDKETYEIPEDVLNFPQLKIIRRPKDLGPIMKLIPAVEEALALGDPEAMVITIDDDTVYAKGMIGQLVKESILRNAVTAGWGDIPSHFGVQREWPESRKDYPALNIVEGYKGIAYPVKFVNVSRMIEVSRLGEGNVCKTSDDIVISWVLAEAQVSRFQVINKFYPGIRQLQFGFEGDALHNGAGCHGSDCSFFKRYQACAKAISESKKP